ncbi:MAG: methyltransferase domain-containing protein [bacterium]
MTHDNHQAFFDELAVEWDSTFTAVDLEFLEHLVSKMDAQPGWDVLDLGCGTGVLFDLLRRQTGEKGSVTGVDFSIQMALKAHRNFPFDNVNVVDADVTTLPFGDSTFDMAVAFASFPHFSDKTKSLHELHRVLKDGARFYIVHLESSKELTELHLRIGGAVAEDRLPSEDNLRRMFAGSRFGDVSVRDHSGLYFVSALNHK